MPTNEAPTQVNEPKRPAETNVTGKSPASVVPALDEEPRSDQPASPVVRGSRWVDYDTHELLQMISELEDERRWARLREGVWLEILVHLMLLTAIFLLPSMSSRCRRSSIRRRPSSSTRILPIWIRRFSCHPGLSSSRFRCSIR